MFGEGNSGNALLPPLVEGSLQYDVNTLPQLQLFGEIPIGCSINPVSYVANECPPAPVHPTKRVRDAEPNFSQQKLRISLNNNFCQDEVGQTGNIWKSNPVSTGLKLSYGEEERNSSITSAAENNKAILPAFLSLGNNVKYEIDRQREDLDRHIKVQGDNLCKGLKELSQRHTISFLNALEKGVSRKLHEKEVEIENMNRKNKELGEKIKQVAMEAQSWHYRAKYNESVVNALKNNIQQLAAQGITQVKEGCGECEVDDAASTTNHQDVASSGVPSSKQQQQLSCCRACKNKQVSVLLLSCRHLCLCTDCEEFIDICPVCQAVKTASVQVYMA
nr:probable BOI-related E3 ubiquitin-protein ligase 2 [Ipomoea trifida]